MTTGVPEEAVSKGDSAAPALAHARVPGRKRARWRRRVKRAGLAILLLVVLAGVVLFPYVTATPRPTVDHVADLDRIAREMQPEGENAAPIYLMAARAWEDAARSWTRPDGQRYSLTNLELLVDGSLDDPRHAERIERFLKHRSLLDTLYAAEPAPGFFLARAGSGASPAGKPMCVATSEVIADMVDLARFRRILPIEMRLAAHEGDWERVRAAARAGFLLSVRMSLAPWTTHHIFAVSIRATMLHACVLVLLEEPASPAACDALLGEVEALPPMADGLALGAEEHVRSVLDYVQRGWSTWHWWGGGVDCTWADTCVDMHPPSMLDRLSNVQAALKPGRREALEEAARFESGLRAWVAAPPEERERNDPDRAQYRALEGILTNPYDGSAIFPSGLTCEHWGKVDEQLRSMHAGTRLAIRLVRHRAEYGAWPASAGEASPPELLVDPVSNRPFEYAVDPEQPFGASLRIPGQAPEAAWADLFRARDALNSGHHEMFNPPHAPAPPRPPSTGPSWPG